MKLSITVLLFVLSSVSQAALYNSDYEASHIRLIERSLLQECGLGGLANQTSSQVTTIGNDQIVDLLYTTVLSVRTGHDQSDNNQQVVEIKTKYINAYDFSTGNWGSYVLEDIKCEQ